jgi:hypothetical protein
LSARLIWLAALCWTGAAQQRTFVGAAACGACHPSELDTQSQSAHARSLYRAAGHPLGSSFAATGLRRGDFTFQVLRVDRNLLIRANDGRHVTELPLEWAFGAGEQAVTFVSRVSPEHHLEHAFSYYADSSSLDITPRHDTLPSRTLNEAMGQPIRTHSGGASIVSCFRCHSTGPVTTSPAGEVQIGAPGVHCESCHGPGSEHRAAALRGNAAAAKSLIDNPAGLSARDLNLLCSRCHRTGAEKPALDWNSPWSVRHQPPFLARSLCSQKSPSGLSCMACHNSHEPLRRNDAAYYRAVCLGCHRAGSRPPAEVCGGQRETDCARCHMPVVAADRHLKFRNHWIGVYGAGSVLRPLH